MRAALVIAVALGVIALGVLQFDNSDVSRAHYEPLPGDGESCCGPTSECEFCEVGR